MAKFSMHLTIFEEMAKGLIGGMKEGVEQAIFCSVSERDGQRVLRLELWKVETLHDISHRILRDGLLGVRELRGPMVDKTLARLERDEACSILDRGDTVQTWLEAAWDHQDAVAVECSPADRSRG